MSDKLERVTIKIVGFRVGVVRAVYYKKLELPSDEEFGKYMNIAFHVKKCDFVSVRRI